MRKVVAMMLVGVALYAAFAIYSGLDVLGDALQSFAPSAFVAACALAFGNYVLRFFKWEFYLATLKIRGIPKLESFLIFLSGFVLTVTPGKVGEVYKSAVLQERHGVALAKTAPIVVADRVSDVLGIVVLIAIGSLGFPGGLLWAGIGLALVLVLLAVVSSRALSLRLLGVLERGPGPLRRIGPKLREAYESLALLVKPANLIVPTLISIVAWLLECLALWVIVRGFGVHTPVELCLFFYATSTLAGAVIPVPGGLGITEGSLLEQLTKLGGVPAGVATASMLLVRFATLWFAVIVGFVALSVLRVKKPR